MKPPLYSLIAFTFFVRNGGVQGNSNTSSILESYLLDQKARQEQHSQNSSSNLKSKLVSNSLYAFVEEKTKKKGKRPYPAPPKWESPSPFSAKKKKVDAEQAQPRSQLNALPKSSPLKKSILKPKKKPQLLNLGSITSEREEDQRKRTPRRLLSECVAFEGCEEGSDEGSEYVPSEDEVESDWQPDELEDVNEEGQSKSSTTKQKKKSSKTNKPKSECRIKRTKDDSNMKNYQKRLSVFKKELLEEKLRKIEEGEIYEEDIEYEELGVGCRIPQMVWQKLYRYQKTGVKWMWELHSKGCGGILGDEMGLGKTVQVIAFLTGLKCWGDNKSWRRGRGLGPVLIVCPATLLHQWLKHFHDWWAPFRVAVLHSSGGYEGDLDTLVYNINKDCGVIITSYTGMRDNIESLLHYSWHYVVLDEGHKIRNPDAQITLAVKRFNTPHRLILSGSPIQNSLKELWSLFDFVFPGKLGTLPVFLQQFSVPITQAGYANANRVEVETGYKCALLLRDTINPYLLRRMKADVKSHLTLPDKSEQVLFCGLTDEQRSVYKNYIDGDQVSSIMHGRMKVFVGLINLRKICNHPDLYTGGTKLYRGETVEDLPIQSTYGWWEKSGKMQVSFEAVVCLYCYGNK